MIVFPQTLTVARWLGREKRFTVHCELAGGRRVAAHTNNTGRLTGCVAPGCRCWLRPAADPRRKLAWTLELTEVVARPAGMTDRQAAALEAVPVATGAPVPAPGRVLVGVDTALPGPLVAAAISAGTLPQFAGCTVERAEAAYPTDIAPRSRADLLLRDPDGAPVWVEIKNVTWVREGLALFPDAPTDRGRKHLRDLTTCVAAGQRAALVFCVQRNDAQAVAAARDIDPEYAMLLQQAARAGVELAGLLVTVGPDRLEPAEPLPVEV